ncbi:hypothetical protein QAD02_009634 [Eretmocerus hayati]|uniref:Uncharacterized protein n=1 Tax=Eretmocerus hayati TaxID=131215 RepID=A0ACC2NA83_9HYME|nr:hypothetical protein QAD02_009634 [Eretmocerus hayati]
MAPPTKAWIRCYDSKKQDRFVSVAHLFKKDNFKSPFLPKDDDDFDGKRVYFSFRCRCKGKDTCECDMLNEKQYYKCIIFGLGGPGTDWEQKKAKTRAAFPTKPKEDSDKEDNVRKDKLKKAKKNEIRKAVAKKTYGKTISLLKSGKLTFASVHTPPNATMPSNSKGQEASTTHIRRVLENYKVRNESTTRNPQATKDVEALRDKHQHRDQQPEESFEKVPDESPNHNSQKTTVFDEDMENQYGDSPQLGERNEKLNESEKKFGDSDNRVKDLQSKGNRIQQQTLNQNWRDGRNSWPRQLDARLGQQIAAQQNHNHYHMPCWLSISSLIKLDGRHKGMNAVAILQVFSGAGNGTITNEIEQANPDHFGDFQDIPRDGGEDLEVDGNRIDLREQNGDDEVDVLPAEEQAAPGGGQYLHMKKYNRQLYALYVKRGDISKGQNVILVNEYNVL